MGPIWGRQDPGGPHVGPMNFAIWDVVVAGLDKVTTAASWSSGRVQDSGLGSRSRVQYPAAATARCAPEQGTSRCTASLDPGGNGYLWGQICKPWRKVACERLYTPQGVEMVIHTDMDSKWPNDHGRYLSKSAEQSSEPVNVLLFSNVVLAGHTSEQMILKIVWCLN